AALPQINWRAEANDGEKLTYVLQDLTVKSNLLTQTQKDAAMAAFKNGMQVAGATKELQKYWPEIGKATCEMEKLYKQYKDGVEAAKKAAEAQAKWNKEVQDALSFMTPWYETIQTID